MAFVRARQPTKLAVCEVWTTTLNACVRSVKLCPSLLKQGHPDFLSFAGCKRDISILVYWQIVINYDRCLDSVDVEIHQVAAC